MPPLSARRLAPALPPLLTAVVAQGARTRTEPFVGTDDVSRFYYKVQSPVILIEFDHEPGVVFDTTSRAAATCTPSCAHPTGTTTGTIYSASTTSRPTITGTGVGR
jgi:hypothetical protein